MKMTIILQNFTVCRDFLHFFTVFKYLSKNTFFQIFECMSLKVLDTGSLQACKYSQIHANSQASCAPPKIEKNLFLLFW